MVLSSVFYILRDVIHYRNMKPLKGLKLISGYANRDLSERIANNLNLPLGNVKTKTFADGETQIKVEESLRGDHIVLIQPTCPPVNDTFMELCIIVDALSNASAEKITIVLPYMGYLRQDKKDAPRDPITAKLVCQFIEVAGADRVMIMDPHFEQVTGYFDKTKTKCDLLYGGKLIGDYCKSIGWTGDDVMVVSPDTTGLSRSAKYMSDYLCADLGAVAKHRPEANKSEVMFVVGDVSGKRCLILDDMLDTGGTVINGAKALYDRGAKEVRCAVSHALLSKDASQRIYDSNITEFICLDTVAVPASKMHGKITVLDSSHFLANAIRNTHLNESVSQLYSDYRKKS